VGGAGGSGGSCTAAYTQTGTGGVPNSPAVLYNFDSGTTVPSGWSAAPGYQTTDMTGVLTPPSTAYSGTEKNQCAGSLKGVFPFTSYSLYTSTTDTHEIGVLQYNAPGVLDWTGKTKLHAWYKVDTANGTGHINFLQFFANTSGYNHYISTNGSGSWWDGAWHEIVVDLTTAGFIINDVKQFGLQINLQATAPGGGPAVPPTTTVYLDDIWLE